MNRLQERIIQAGVLWLIALTMVGLGDLLSPSASSIFAYLVGVVIASWGFGVLFVESLRPIKRGR